MGDQPLLKKMGPYKRLEYDSTGIRYGFSARTFFVVTPKSEHWGKVSNNRKTHFLKSLKNVKNEDFDPPEAAHRP